MKLSIKELAEKFNSLPDNNLLEYKTSDKRVRNDISVRRIQSYITQGLLDKPIKEGNRAYFNESHLNKLINLRLLAVSGLSDNSLKNIDTISTQLNLEPDDILKINAINALNEIQSKNALYSNSMADTVLSNVSTSLLVSTRNWQEHQLDKEGKVFIKKELGLTLNEKEKEELVSSFKKFLNMEN